jgi:hypothetical protein
VSDRCFDTINQHTQSTTEHWLPGNEYKFKANLCWLAINQYKLVTNEYWLIAKEC